MLTKSGKFGVQLIKMTHTGKTKISLSVRQYIWRTKTVLSQKEAQDNRFEYILKYMPESNKKSFD